MTKAEPLPDNPNGPTFTNHYREFDSGVAIYHGNPCIGALGPIRTKDESTKLLTQPKHLIYDPAESRLAPHLRLHSVQSLSWVFLPGNVHVAVDQELGMLIRKGYIGRNPLSTEFRQLVHEDRPYLQRKILPPPRFEHRPILGACAAGPAGTGKTMTFRLVADSYPRSIEHVYIIEEGGLYAFTQVPMLMLEVQPDCSIKELAVEFFRRLGEAVGRNLVQQWDVVNGSESSLQASIYSACREYHVGLIILDEAQNVTARGRSKGHAVQYLSRLMNSIGVPIVLIGTDGISTLMESWLALGRRFTGGIPRFERFKKGPFWDEFLRQIWKYQYLREESDYRDFSDLILDLTAGIPDLVIKLYMLTQARLFGRERECITTDALNETAHCLFYLVKSRLVDLKTTQCEKPPGDTAAVVEAIKLNFDRFIAEETRRLSEANTSTGVMQVGGERAPNTRKGRNKKSMHSEAGNHPQKENDLPDLRSPTAPPRLTGLTEGQDPIAFLAKLGVLEPPT